MRPLKIVAIVIVSLLVLLVGGIAALFAFVDPNDYRDDIERIAKERTGRDLRIGGELDLDLFPWLALRIEDVTLGNPPGYGDKPFLTVERASVGVKLLPLLRKSVEVSRVSVEQLAVELVSRGEEDNNWKDLVEEEEQPQPERESKADATIAGIDVTRSQLVYRDEVEKSALVLKGLEVHAGRIGGDEPVRAQVEFDLEQQDAAEKDEPAPPMHVKLDALAQMPRDSARIELEDVKIDGTRGKTPFSVSTPALVVDLDAETLAPTDLDVRYGALPMRIAATGQKLFSDRQVFGALSVPQASPRDVMRSLEIEAPNTADPKALSKLAMQGQYRLTENTFQLSKLDITLDDTRLRGTLGIDDLEKLALRFDLTVDNIDVDRYLGPEPKEGDGAAGGTADAAKPAEAEEPTELPLDALRELNARGELRVGRARLSGLEFTNVRLPLDARGGVTRLGPTSAQLFGGNYAGNTVLDARPARARLSMDERVSGVDIGAIMKATFDSTRLAGRADATVTLTGTGNTDTAILKSLSGKTTFDIKEGALNGIDLWYELRRARALWKREPPPQRPAGPVRTAFNVFKGSALLDSGVVKNDDLRIESDFVRAGGRGSLNLDTQTIDYRVVAEVYRIPPEGAGAEMGDLKAAEIPMTITGTLAEPKVRPDLGALVKQQVKEKVNEEIEQKKEEVKKRITDKLKDLIGN